MSSRVATCAALLLIVVLTLLACGVNSEVRDTDSVVLTAELVVPPSSQEVSELPSATQLPPTATSLPPTSIANPESDMAQNGALAQDRATVNVPNRGYNSMGSDEAPITMFDFSDFL